MCSARSLQNPRQVSPQHQPTKDLDFEETSELPYDILESSEWNVRWFAICVVANGRDSAYSLVASRAVNCLCYTYCYRVVLISHSRKCYLFIFILYVFIILIYFTSYFLNPSCQTRHNALSLETEGCLPLLHRV